MTRVGHRRAKKARRYPARQFRFTIKIMTRNCAAKILPANFLHTLQLLPKKLPKFENMPPIQNYSTLPVDVQPKKRNFLLSFFRRICEKRSMRRSKPTKTSPDRPEFNYNYVTIPCGSPRYLPQASSGESFQRAPARLQPAGFSMALHNIRLVLLPVLTKVFEKFFIF